MRNKIFDYSFLALGLLIQVVTFVLNRHMVIGTDQLSVISLISGCLGICSVCLTAQGNILTFLFGFAQVGTYTWLCILQRFYGGIAINAYYFLTMIYGVYAWSKRLKTPSVVTTRQLRPGLMAVIVLAVLAGSCLTGWGLANWTSDTQPYLDAFTTIPALVAQALMILVYREHWFLWLAVDVLSVVLWVRVGDWCMAAQYVFWSANCLYGLHRWKHLEN